VIPVLMPGIRLSTKSQEHFPEVQSRLNVRNLQRPEDRRHGFGMRSMRTVDETLSTQPNASNIVNA